ncbi:MAG: glycoside hydrolase family 28 protein [Clostridia bacterium]|nr:glycoside hydrolase family 28 protein [Clostridia bacterium]
MINKIVFEDEITVWWDKVFDFPSDGEFVVFMDGKACGRTKKTHYTLKGLRENTAYEIAVSAVDGSGSELETLDRVSLKTLKKKKRLDVTKEPYCAVGDGVTLNTAALQKAFDDCKAGECVYFPSGVYLTGALNVGSDTEIYLEKNAVLQGTGYVEDYLPKRKSRFEGIEMECYSSLINMGELDRFGGYNCQNVVIRGGGTISGGGELLSAAIIETERERLREFLQKNKKYVAQCENENTLPGRARGRLVNMSNCKNVVFSGVTLQYGPSWNVHFVYSKDIVTCGCRIVSQGVWNGDGWDPDSSEDCTVFDTEFFTHDDSIAIKSGKNPEGNVINRPTKNVKIFDCRGRNGIAIGSEMSGGIDGVYIWDCDFSSSYSGLYIKTTRKRGGYVRNVCVNDSKFVSVSVFSELTYNNDGESAAELPKVENIAVENVELTGTRVFADGETENLDCIELFGLEEAAYHLENVKFKDVRLRYRKNGEQVMKLRSVKNLTLENINFIN